MLVLKINELVKELPSVRIEFPGLTTGTKKNQKCATGFLEFAFVTRILMWLHVESWIGMTIHRIALYNPTPVKYNYYSPESRRY